MGHDAQLGFDSKDSGNSLLGLPLQLLKFALVSSVSLLPASSQSDWCPVFIVMENQLDLWCFRTIHFVLSRPPPPISPLLVRL